MTSSREPRKTVRRGRRTARIAPARTDLVAAIAAPNSPAAKEAEPWSKVEQVPRGRMASNGKAQEEGVVEMDTDLSPDPANNGNVSVLSELAS